MRADLRSNALLTVCAAFAGAIAVALVLLTALPAPSRNDVPVSKVYGPMDQVPRSAMVGESGMEWAIATNPTTGKPQWQQTVHFLNAGDMVSWMPLDEFPLPADPPIDRTVTVLLGVVIGALAGGTIGARHIRQPDQPRHGA